MTSTNTRTSIRTSISTSTNNKYTIIRGISNEAGAANGANGRA